MLNEYLRQLEKQLDNKQIEEKEDILQYIEEMIKDRMEGGEELSAILSSIGEPHELVNELFPDAKEKKVTDEDERKVREFEDVECIEINNVSYDFHFETTTEDMVTLIYEDSEGTYLDVDYKKGVLRIDQDYPVAGMGGLFASVSKIFSAKGKSLSSDCEATLRIPKDVKIRFKIDNVSGDFSFDEIAGEKFQMNNVSGDLCFTDCAFCKAKIESVSGDLEAEDLSVEDKIDITAVSGDLKLERIKAQDIQLETVSGDIDIAVIGREEETDLKISGLRKSTSNHGFGERSLKISTISGDIAYCFIG